MKNTPKAIAILGGLVLLGFAVFNFLPSTQEFINETIEVEKIVETDKLEVRINEALTAAKASTTAKAQEAYDEVMETETKRVTDEVKADYIAEIEATISDASY